MSMNNNDVVVKLVRVDEEGKEHQEFYKGTFMIIYEGEITIFQSFTEKSDLKFNMSDYITVSVVGKYDENGTEHQHYSQVVAGVPI